MSKEKIATNGGADLGQNPFGALGGLALPNRPAGAAGSAGAGGAGAAAPAAGEAKPAKNRGRVEVLRMTAGRGGKTVTVARAFVGIGLPEKEQLAKKMQKACGCGGTVKDGQIEVQGDKREEVARILTEAGFRPVMAGG
jgi:translation initiation factor 1